MREIRPSGSEGGVTFQPPSLPLSRRFASSAAPDQANPLESSRRSVKSVESVVQKQPEKQPRITRITRTELCLTSSRRLW